MPQRSPAVRASVAECMCVCARMASTTRNGHTEGCRRILAPTCDRDQPHEMRDTHKTQNSRTHNVDRTMMAIPMSRCANGLPPSVREGRGEVVGKSDEVGSNTSISRNMQGKELGIRAGRERSLLGNVRFSQTTPPTVPFSVCYRRKKGSILQVC